MVAKQWNALLLVSNVTLKPDAALATGQGAASSSNSQGGAPHKPPTLPRLAPPPPTTMREGSSGLGPTVRCRLLSSPIIGVLIHELDDSRYDFFAEP